MHAILRHNTASSEQNICYWAWIFALTYVAYETVLFVLVENSLQQGIF